MPVRLTDVADLAGVSLSTASRALNDSDHPMNDQTRQAVLAAAKQLGYGPNIVARSLRTERTLTVGIVVENILSPFIPPIIRGIQDSIDEHGYVSIIMNVDWDAENELRAIKTLNNRQIDGIILVESCIRNSEEVAELKDKPHVFVHRLFDVPSPGSVVPDDHHGAKLAVNHLLKLGHRRIAFINGLENWAATIDRLKGYNDALADADLNADSTLIKDGDWNVQSGYRAVKELLSLAEPPTAVFAGNDLMALGAIYAAQELGMQVPRDLAVVGYDDRDFAGFVRPSITTVQMPCEEMGRKSAEILLSIVNGQMTQSEALFVPGQLIVRESCGVSKGPWEFEPERASLTRQKRTSVRIQ
jgi:DNA-binding LacI/PurR family transcriptional regulator